MNNDKVRALREFYTLQAAHYFQMLIAPEHFDLVESYLQRWRGGYYWEIILNGGIPGYSLFLHELVEIRWYQGNNYDPFDISDQTENYEDAHGEALIYEHRFLQSIARGMDLSFSIKELILHNPHGDTKYDGEVIERLHLNRLTDEDKTYDPQKREGIESFYRNLGFR